MSFDAMNTKNFLGRENEIKVLASIASEAGAGEANSAFLSGKRGIGKTKLLNRLFHHLFEGQGDAVPFLYTVKSSFVSVEKFSSDYLGSFILQYLAFRKKDLLMTGSGVYSLEDLAKLATESEAHWAADLIDYYLRIRFGGDPVNLFLFAISAPYRSYRDTGRPVVVMIDDFHKIRKFCELNAKEDNKDFWTLYETSAGFPHTPHIFTGLEAELNGMFFEETSFGDQLEIIDLPGLDRESSLKIFTLLCGSYGLKVEAETSVLIDLFAGNPFYMKNFLQAARQTGKVVSEDDFWHIYFNEVVRGKTYKYWASLLKKYVPQFNMRKPSLRFLYHLCGGNADIFAEDPEGTLPAEHEKLEHMVGLLGFSGTIEQGFSEVRLTEDDIMTDVIKGLYHREILREPHDMIKDVILGNKRGQVKSAGTPSFSITIPAAPKAELVAVKSLEEIARHFNIPLKDTGQLQIALVELIANVLSDCGSAADGHHLKFGLKDRTFYIEITTSQKDCVLTDENCAYMRQYLDDLKVENLTHGTRIVFNKELIEEIV